jgi:hypothetical protein
VGDTKRRDLNVDVDKIKLLDISTSKDLICNYLIHDKLYKGIMNCESMSSRELYQALRIAPGFIYYFMIGLEREEYSPGPEPIGIWLVHVISDNLVAFHGGLYKQYRNKNTPELIERLIKLTKEYFKLPDLHFITMTPVKGTKRSKFEYIFSKCNVKYRTTISNAYTNGDNIDIWEYLEEKI